MHRTMYLLFLIGLLAGCTPANATVALPTSTAIPAATPTSSPPASDTPPPAETATPLLATATATLTQTPTPEPTETEIPPDSPSLVIYLLRENTGGAVGCGDTLVPVRLNIPPSGDPLADVRTVMEFFFTTKGKYPYGLFDPLYASSIAITSVYWGETEIHVDATGTMTRPQKGCGWDQIREVTNRTALEAAGGHLVEITLNNRPFNDWASADHQ